MVNWSITKIPTDILMTTEPINFVGQPCKERNHERYMGQGRGRTDAPG
jgi:hypothetical protein